MIDRGQDGGHQFIVFEYVEGENLKELVGRAGRLPVQRALEMGSTSPTGSRSHTRAGSSTAT